MAEVWMGPNVDYVVRSLPVSGAGEDPLGISKVSGFYGPGTWSGWYLTIIAAWIQLIVHPKKKLDPNAWFYLIGMNWAAIDIFRHMHSLSIANKQGKSLEYKKKLMGSIAAPYAILYWGLYHAILQLLVAHATTTGIIKKGNLNEQGHRVLFWRRFILSIGVILPLAALSVWALFPPLQEAYTTKEEIFSMFPALYWKGIRGEHVTNLHFSSWGGLAMLPVVLIYTVYMILLNTGASQLLLGIARRLQIFFRISDTSLDFCGVFVVSTIGYGMLLFFSVGPFASHWYFFYILSGTPISESCFFMPCAPQSIMDWDQAFSLTAALILLICTEVIPSLIGSAEMEHQGLNDTQDGAEGVMLGMLEAAELEDMDITDGRVDE